MLEVLPPDIREAIEAQEEIEELLEIVLDLGQKPEARFLNRTTVLSSRQVGWDDLEYVTSRVGEFGKDNRLASSAPCTGSPPSATGAAGSWA